jgi:hypothetical protein
MGEGQDDAAPGRRHPPRLAYWPVPGKQRPVAVLHALPGAQSTAVFWQGKAHFWN